jgi:coiled-coil and C2 domain-containing protein 2A
VCAWLQVKTFVQNLIKGRMEHWRSREGKGHYDNAAMGKELEKILKKMELASHQEMEYTEDMLHTELDKFLKQNEITGFYINRPYTDIEPIIQEIYNADIHHAGPITGEGGNDRDTQFATAVYVKAFPRRILSLWVAVACCARKRS